MGRFRELGFSSSQKEVMNRMRYGTSEELAAWYDKKYTEMGDGWVTPPEECNRHLDDLGVPYDRTKTLLDVGCGAGHFLVEAEKRVTCDGIDISKTDIEFTRKRVQDSGTATIDIGNWPAPRPSSDQYDYIVSIGSLEHVVELDKALDNIHLMLKDDGKFYFFCPNEKWVHEDQPNERTMTDGEWEELFRKHGLYKNMVNRWNDSTAFTGSKKVDVIHVSEVGTWPTEITGNKLNVGSGQRPFAREHGWINLDSNKRWSPDVVADWNDLHMFD